jgi:transposase
MDYWAESPRNREQMALFSPTLDSVISEDDPVRLVDEVLAGIDWSLWEGEYHGKRGQPPIHPRHVAGAILYGMYRGIRSSRKLEESCCYRLDFLWLLEGRQIDHTTFCKFRTRFADPLKDLFKQIGRVAMSLGLIRLLEVGFDGTRVKANNSRYATRTAKTLQEKLAALDELFDQMMSEIEVNDTAETQRTLDGQDDSPTRLPEPLAALQQRREQIRAALDQAKAADESRRKKQGTNPEKNPAQAPTTDPDSRVMPNKEGGYAPNYTPTATTDGHRGFIVDCEVTSDVNEGNPAKREDATVPVPETEWPKLPRNNRGQLDKTCFVYVAEEDQYYCPQGQAMPFAKSKSENRAGAKVNLRVYRCGSCGDCALAANCLSPTSKHGRTITRDEYQEARERTAARMASEAGRKVYNQRPRIAETTFGIMKAVMGIRQFLLRGLQKVKTEWLWACTAFNLGKLASEIGRLRAEFSKLAAEEVG